MKKACVLLIVLVSVVLSCSGCSNCSFFAQEGETSKEGHRRHLRVLDINRAQFMADLDRTFQVDRPSRLSNLRNR